MNNINNISKIDFKVNKSTIEWLMIILLLIFSLFNQLTLIIFFLVLILFLYQREIGAIKILNLITLRTILNPFFAVSIGSAQNLKWLILFLCSFYLLLSFRKLKLEKQKKLIKIILTITLFGIFNIFVALFFSSLPTIAIFKLMSYLVIFTAVIIGVAYTSENYNWLKWIFKLFNLIILFSFFIITFPASYFRNGISFQGVVDHPNMFGIVGVLFISILISYYNYNKMSKLVLYSYILITLYMVIISKSRTAFLACLILLLLYYFINNYKKTNYLNIITISFGLIFLVLSFNNIFSFIKIFLYKGQVKGELLASRSEQIGGLWLDFKNSPLFGNGFSVPVLPFKSYQFSSSFIVEPGNLFLSLLAYSGIIGFLIFILYTIQILLINKKMWKYNVYLFIAPFAISMGEMVFFSSNNIGIWCYMFIAMYMFCEDESRLVARKHC